LQLGIQAQQAMDRGALVSDDLVLAIVDNKLGELDSQKGVLFDGFPRTIVQAQGLDIRLEQRGRMIERVVFFRVPDEAIVDRISGRLTCPLDGIPYHRAYHTPMVSGCCDKCGSTLVQRSDDEEIKVRSRLNAYRTSTAALLPYYASKGLLTEIDGEGTIDEVADRVNAALAG
jgi:adenylate kinase